VKTLKVKFKHLGVNQHDCYLSYNTKNGRYEELEYQPTELDHEVKAKRLDYTNWLTKQNNRPAPSDKVEVSAVNQPNIDFDLEFDDQDY